MMRTKIEVPTCSVCGNKGTLKRTNEMGEQTRYCHRCLKEAHEGEMLRAHPDLLSEIKPKLSHKPSVRAFHKSPVMLSVSTPGQSGCHTYEKESIHKLYSAIQNHHIAGSQGHFVTE